MRLMSLRTATARYLAQEEGTVSVEFMYMAPLLILWLIGSFVYWEAFHSLSQTSKVAYTISDIVSRHDAVDDDDMDDLFDMERRMLPRSVDGGWLRITSICFNDDLYRVMWSFVGDDMQNARVLALEDDTIDLSLMPVMTSGDSIILTEVFAAWTPVSDIIGLGSQVWKNRLVTRPRFVTMVPHARLNPSLLCPEAP